MSHIARIKSKMVEQEYVLRGLDDLNYRYDVGDLSIGGVLMGRQRVDIKVKFGLLRRVGLRKQGSAFEALADSDLISRSRLTKFIEQLTQRYAYHAVRDRLDKQGFNLITEENQKDGQIRLVLRRAS